MFNEKIVCESANEAYQELHSLLSSQGLESAPRGLSIKELLNVNVVITNPRDRIVADVYRKMDIAYAFGELAWYLDARNDVVSMKYYSKFMESMSDDGVTLNSAYGYRIFGKHNLIGFNQFENVIRLLSQDSDSRQAVIHLHTPNNKMTKDEVCTMSLQFLIREGKLDMITTMRSNDLVLGFVYDIFSFTMLQEILANELGVELGVYYHNVGSMHIYQNGYYSNKDVEKMSNSSGSVPMKPFSWRLEDFERMIAFEKRCRNFANISDNDIDERIDELLEEFSKSFYGCELIYWYESAFLMKLIKEAGANAKTGLQSVFENKLISIVEKESEWIADVLELSIKNSKFKNAVTAKKIIVEGPDKAGKSTIVNKLLKKNENAVARHYGIPSETFDFVVHYNRHMIMDNEEIFDRFWPSEVVYSQVFRPGMSNLNRKAVEILIDKSAQYKDFMQYIFVLPEDEEQVAILKSRLSNSDDKWILNKIDEVIEAYRALVAKMRESQVNVKIIPIISLEGVKKDG